LLAAKGVSGHKNSFQDLLTHQHLDENAAEKLMLSKTKHVIKLLSPPILSRGLSRYRRPNSKPDFEYVPGGWKTLPTPDNSACWNNDDVVNVETAKWGAFRDNLLGTGPLGFSHESTDPQLVGDLYFHNIHITYAYVLALAARQKTKLSLLDWGGGLGHYYLLGKAVLPEVSLDFHCREVPIMCEYGKKLCPEVHFYSEDSCLNRRYDLAMLNGSLGYFEDWIGTLTKVASTVDEFLFLTRVFVVDRSRSFVVLHRTANYGYKSNMLTQVFNKREILTVVEAAGLRLVREFVVGEGPTIVGAPEACTDRGWLFKREL
jgi:putative methyltransferase (TIGR04325 family)